MSFKNLNISFLDIALAAICFVLLLLSSFLLFRLLRRRKQCTELRGQLEFQKSRVAVRKKKIWELRKKIGDLSARLSESDRKLLTSYTQEEIGALYPEIIDGLRKLLKDMEVNQLSQRKRANVMSAALKLAHFLQTSFRVAEEPVLEDEEEKQEDETAADNIVTHRVLIVDDNEQNRRATVEVVETCGFLADQAANGEEAIEKIRVSREGYYDLILMDIIMPGKNGYDTCRDIRKLMRADCERIPVIALTANNFSEDYVQLIDAGMNDRFPKPINRDSFLSLVDKWLRRKETDTQTTEEAGVWSSVLTSDGSAATAR